MGPYGVLAGFSVMLDFSIGAEGFCAIVANMICLPI